jgi:hypothetical protein
MFLNEDGTAFGYLTVVVKFKKNITGIEHRPL